MSLTEGTSHLADQVMSARSARCPDCGHRFFLAYEFGYRPGLIDPAGASRYLLDHAREMPILHPTLLPEHHALRRTA